MLDLGVQGRRVHFHLGIDEPVYLSRHSPPGHLAPSGGALVHVMRYEARGSEEDRKQLWRVAAAAGIHKADVVTERFLHRMIAPAACRHLEGAWSGGRRSRSQNSPGSSSLVTGSALLAGSQAGPWPVESRPASGAHESLSSSERRFLRTDVASIRSSAA